MMMRVVLGLGMVTDAVALTRYRGLASISRQRPVRVSLFQSQISWGLEPFMVRTQFQGSRSNDLAHIPDQGPDH